MKPFDNDIEITETGGFAYEADKRRVYDYLKFAFAGRKVRLRLSESRRSTRANSYMWAVVYETIRLARLEVGMPPVSSMDLHRHFKALYLPVRTVEVFGVDHTWEGSSADLDSTSFFDFVESIRTDEEVMRVLAFANMEIPEPDPNYRSYKIAGAA